MSSAGFTMETILHHISMAYWFLSFKKLETGRIGQGQVFSTESINLRGNSPAIFSKNSDGSLALLRLFLMAVTD